MQDFAKSLWFPDDFSLGLKDSYFVLLNLMQCLCGHLAMFLG